MTMNFASWFQFFVLLSTLLGIAVHTDRRITRLEDRLEGTLRAASDHEIRLRKIEGRG